MIYFTTSCADARPAMADGRLGAMLAPGGGSGPPEGALYACDNGRFGKGWRGGERWWAWLLGNIARHGPERCAFAVAPDVVGDAAATLIEAAPWLPRIRALGIPAAFVAQNGCEAVPPPWGAFDVLFLGGDDAFKLGPVARAVTAEALARGLPVHMGRVNSRRRFRYADAIGCSSADGTYVAFGPDLNLPQLLGWSEELRQSLRLFD